MKKNLAAAHSSTETEPANAIAAWSRSMFPCAAQYRSSNRQFVGSGTAISRSTSLRSFRCRQFDHNVISESKELISRQRRAILL
jgi:hypothetical protein